MSVFSSLRTEGDRTNHLFIPSKLQIANYQDDLVRPIASSDAWLDMYADNESLLPFTELRRRIWEHTDVPVRSHMSARAESRQSTHRVPALSFRCRPSLFRLTKSSHSERSTRMATHRDASGNCRQERLGLLASAIRVSSLLGSPAYTLTNPKNMRNRMLRRSISIRVSPQAGPRLRAPTLRI